MTRNRKRGWLGEEYPRATERWTITEDRVLIRRVRAAKNKQGGRLTWREWWAVSQKHGRSRSAIIGRLAVLRVVKKHRRAEQALEARTTDKKA